MPSAVTAARLTELLDHVASGIAVERACDMLNLPARTVWRRLRADDATWQAYARAKVCSADVHADKIIAVADRVLAGELDANAARVGIDALKWQASKLRPDQYGERMEHKLTADSGLLSALQAIEARIKQPPALEAPVVDVTPNETEVTQLAHHS